MPVLVTVDPDEELRYHVLHWIHMHSGLPSVDTYYIFIRLVKAFLRSRDDVVHP